MRVFESESAAEWQAEMSSSAVVQLVPRGYGRSSFRSAEAVQLGVPQIVVYDDSDPPWVPYYDPASPGRQAPGGPVWGPGGVGWHTNLSGLPAVLDGLACAMAAPHLPCAGGGPPPRAPYSAQPGSVVDAMRARARALADSPFTLAGVVARIREFIAAPHAADLVCVQTPATLISSRL